MNFNPFFNKKPRLENVIESKETKPENFLKRFWKSKYFALVPIISVLFSAGKIYHDIREQDKEEEQKARRTSLELEYSDINLSHMDVDSIKAIMDEVEVMMAGDGGNQFEMLKGALGRDATLNREFFQLFQDKETRARLKHLGQYFMFYESMFYRLTRDSATLAKLDNPMIDNFIEKAHLEPKKGKKNFVFNVYEILNLDPEKHAVIFDPIYLRGIARAQECDIVASYFPSAETFQVLGSDDEVYNFVKKLRTSFDVAVPSFFIQGLADTRQELNGETSLMDEPTREDYINIDLEKNKTVLEFARGTSLSENVFSTLSYDKEFKYNTFFSNPEYKESLARLQSLGVTVDQIITRPLDKLDIIKSKNFLNLLEQLSWQAAESSEGYGIEFQDLVMPLSNILEEGDDLETFIYEKYNLVTEEGCNAFLDNLAYLNSTMPNALKYDKLRIVDKVDVLRNIYENIDGNALSNPEEKLPTEFLEDPSLSYLIELGYHKKVPPLFELLSKRTQAEWLMRTVRNMSMSDVDPTEENFMKYFLEMLDMRTNSEFTSLKMFQNRNVACLANNEKQDSITGDVTISSTLKRFLPDSLQKAIASQSPQNLSIFRGTEDPESLRNAKRSFLEYIENHNNLTVVVDGHGSSEMISISGNAEGLVAEPTKKQQEPITISYDELADAFEKREQAGFSDRPIIIFSMCSNQEFLRKFYRALERKSVAGLPICIGESEFGQYSFSDEKDYNSLFFRELFLRNKNKKLIIQDVIDIEQDNLNKPFLNTNPSIFFPVEIKNKNGKRDIHWQIAEQKYLDRPDDRARQNPFQA